MTTTKNEALRVLKANQRTRPVPAIDDPRLEHERQEATAAEQELLRDERHQAVRDGLAELRPEQRALLLLLHAEPAISYEEISNQQTPGNSNRKHRTDPREVPEEAPADRGNPAAGFRPGLICTALHCISSTTSPRPPCVDDDGSSNAARFAASNHAAVSPVAVAYLNSRPEISGPV